MTVTETIIIIITAAITFALCCLAIYITLDIRARRERREQKTDHDFLYDQGEKILEIVKELKPDRRGKEQGAEAEAREKEENAALASGRRYWVTRQWFSSHGKGDGEKVQKLRIDLFSVFLTECPRSHLEFSNGSIYYFEHFDTEEEARAFINHAEVGFEQEEKKEAEAFRDLSCGTPREEKAE